MRISDWSSDVCSSDLEPAAQTRGKPRGMAAGWWALEGCPGVRAGVASDGWWGGGAADHELGGEDVVGDLGGRRRAGVGGVGFTRSEERRVGNECVRTCRSWWSPYH